MEHTQEGHYPTVLCRLRWVWSRLAGHKLARCRKQNEIAIWLFRFVLRDRRPQDYVPHRWWRRLLFCGRYSIRSNRELAPTTPPDVSDFLRRAFAHGKYLLLLDCVNPREEILGGEQLKNVSFLDLNDASFRVGHAAVSAQSSFWYLLVQVFCLRKPHSKD